MMMITVQIVIIMEMQIIILTIIIMMIKLIALYNIDNDRKCAVGRIYIYTYVHVLCLNNRYSFF